MFKVLKRCAIVLMACIVIFSLIFVSYVYMYIFPKLNIYENIDKFEFYNNNNDLITIKPTDYDFEITYKSYITKEQLSGKVIYSDGTVGKMVYYSPGNLLKIEGISFFIYLKSNKWIAYP